MKIFIFAWSIIIVHGNKILNDKFLLRSNSPLGYVDRPSRRDFISMKLIPLSALKNRGKYFNKYFSQVDDDMYKYLIHWPWHVSYDKGANIYYAQRAWKGEDGKTHTVREFRYIQKPKNG